MSVTMHKHTSAAAVDVILRDGSTLRLRAPARGDAGALASFFTGLSERSLYQRFHGIRAIDEELIVHFLEPDWGERGVLVGTLAGAEGDERIVALGEYERLRDPAAAEVAFAVADELQGRGIGTRLLERLARARRRAGIERFVAEVLPDNAAMLRRVRGRRLRGRRASSTAGEVEVRFPIAPTEAVPRARRRARPRRRRRLAAPVLRAASRSPWSARPAAAARSAASCSGTCWPPTSPAPPTRSTAAASRSPASAATRRSRTSRTRSTSRSSACPASGSRRRRGGARAGGRARSA